MVTAYFDAERLSFDDSYKTETQSERQAKL